ncbi:hypothetical protein F5141DRAFT_1060849 [Pisolithus sp. B1]|nr:hypothetical protein F5141DRAFT_1060849 [Pisolithus sp. B1]
MVTVYGWACLNDHGAVVMTSTMLNYIVNCVHHQKIQTCQDLKREAGWMNSNWFGDEVLNLIQQHAAPTMATSLLLPEIAQTYPQNIAAGAVLVAKKDTMACISCFC